MLNANYSLIVCHKNCSIIVLNEEAIPKVFMGDFVPLRKVVGECRIKLIKMMCKINVNG